MRDIDVTTDAKVYQEVRYELTRFATALVGRDMPRTWSPQWWSAPWSDREVSEAFAIHCPI